MITNIDDLVRYGNSKPEIYTNVHSGVTKQCLERATEQIINNIKKACI